MNNLSIIENLNVVTAEIREGMTLLELIYRNTNEDPSTDASVACLLRSFGKTLDKADNMVSGLTRQNRLLHSCSRSVLQPATNPNTIGFRIQLARENLDMSLDDLAAAVIPGDVEVLSEWENSKSEPCASEVIRLANALKCDPMWLLTGENSNRQISADSGE
ncbi:helix-turn-helix domain-containing protein [Salmonella enterica]|nr:helix-turn-helix domain-containing protein [Salmonella enterica]